MWPFYQTHFNLTHLKRSAIVYDPSEIVGQFFDPPEIVGQFDDRLQKVGYFLW